MERNVQIDDEIIFDSTKNTFERQHKIQSSSIFFMKNIINELKTTTPEYVLNIFAEHEIVIVTAKKWNFTNSSQKCVYLNANGTREKAICD